MHQATIASVSTELEQVEEFAEEVTEFNTEAKDITDDAGNFSMSIHMPTFNQEDSKVSFLKENSNFAHNSLATNFDKDNLNHQVSNTDINEKAADRKVVYNLIPEDQNMPDTNKFVSNSLDNKLNNWNDNSVAVKSQTNIDWPSEKRPLKSSAKDVRSSQVDFELNSPSNYFQGAPISNGHVTYKINPTTNQDFAYLNRNKLVNRRLAIKKQNEYSYGLPAIGKSSSENISKSNNKSEFALGSENMLNELRNIENPVDMNNYDEADNSYPFGYYKNISSNVVHNVKPKSGKLRKHINPAEVAKSSTIIVLEREKSLPPDEGPSPATYHLPRRPPMEKNSPMFTIGKRCFNEKGGGGRTSWEKEWYNSKSPYTIKSDFRRELFWPTPANYRIKSTMGIDSNKAVFYQYPNHSISNLQTRSAKAGGNSASMPTPSGNNNTCHHTSNIVLSRDDLIEKDMKNCSVIKEFNVNDPMSARDQLELDVNQSSSFVSHSAPKVSFKFRERGTQLWSNVEKTPGPGAYDHTKFKTSSRHNRTPQFSVGQSKHALNYSVGPFATL